MQIREKKLLHYFTLSDITDLILNSISNISPSYTFTSILFSTCLTCNVTLLKSAILVSNIGFKIPYISLYIFSNWI